MTDPRHFPTRRMIRIANPAAGAEFSITPTTSGLWLVRSIVFTLTADGNAANRIVRVTADDGTTEYFRTVARTALTAGLANVYAAFNGSSGDAVVGSVAMLSWPTDGLSLPPGHRLRTSTDAIQVGDQFSAIGLEVVDFPTGPGFASWPLTPAVVERSH